ncbi:gp33 [Sphingomonas phage PAU]|uniref:gp33 n=1 Tax=Sphingomonas phage PAU TaxID=1150991 RepID=UPI0002573126|nr:gp33 [Sphingomonas phage PAU]AFF28031.1 gp33 [Sphingomonas phage PAU]
MGCHTWFYVLHKTLNNKKAITELALNNCQKNIKSVNIYADSITEFMEEGDSPENAHLKALRRYWDSFKSTENSVEISDEELLDFYDSINLFEEYAYLIESKTKIEEGDYDTIMDFCFDYVQDYERKTWQLYVQDTTMSNEPRVANYPPIIIRSFQQFKNCFNNGVKDQDGKIQQFRYNEERLDRFMNQIEQFFKDNPKGLMTFG